MLLIPGIIGSGVQLGDFESIATVTVGAGGAANATFSSIPSAYQHLQIRYIARSDEPGNAFTNINMRFNSDSGSNYVRHQLAGDGAAASSGASTGQTGIQIQSIPAATATANIFGVGVIDILDYANTNKNTTVRCLGGQDQNGSGFVILRSGLWINTAAVTSILLYPTNNNFIQHSTFALYGIKG